MSRGFIQVATGAVAVLLLTLIGFVGLNVVAYALFSPEPAIENVSPDPGLNLVTKAD